jgi:hypothetical protein
MKLRFIACLVFITSALHAEFRAGAATSNITPELGSSINGGFQDGKALAIHDELNARCLALDDGQTKLVFVVADSCVIGRGIFDEAKKMVNAATGLPMENMMMSATHSHSCGTLQAVGQSEPNPIYQRFVARRIADGVRRALEQPRSCQNRPRQRLGAASGLQSTLENEARQRSRRHRSASPPIR